MCQVSLRMTSSTIWHWGTGQGMTVTEKRLIGVHARATEHQAVTKEKSQDSSEDSAAQKIIIFFLDHSFNRVQSDKTDDPSNY